MVFFRGLNQQKADSQFFNTSIAKLKGVVKKRQKISEMQIRIFNKILMAA
jgi:hypothetical protein